MIVRNTMLKMKKLLCALCALAILVTAGCSLVEVDKEKDMQQVVATVNGQPVVKEDLKRMFDDTANMYAQYGMDIRQMGDMTEMIDSLIEELIGMEVIKQQAETQGLSQLSDEENGEIDKEVQDLVDYYVEMYVPDAQAALGENASEDAVRKKARDMLDENLKQNDVSLDDIRKSYVEQKVEEKLRDSVDATVTVGEDELQKWYTDTLAEQKKTFAESLSSYANAAAMGDTVVFVPEGLVYAKRILLIGPEDADAQEKIEAQKTAQQTYASQMTDLIVEDKTANQEQIDALEVKINEAKNEYQRLRNQWLSAIKSKADEVLSKVKAGEDFDALVAEYGEDELMKQSPAKEEGFLVGKGLEMEQEIIDAAMALANAGDVTELIPSSEGYSIIKLVGKVPSRDVPLSEVREAAESTVKEQKQQETWDEKMTQWREAAKVEKFPERYKDIGQ